MAHNPLVSIVMPVYNVGPYLEACLESIFAQTYNHWELIIINDGSTDHSLKLIKDIIARQKSAYVVRLLGFNRHCGLVECLNYGLEQAEGEFVARMDADDIMHPERLERQVSYLLREKNVDFCGTWVCSFTSKREDLIKAQPRTLKLHFSPCTNRSIQAALLFYDPLYHPTLMWRRNWQQAHLPLYRNNFAPAEDYDAWIRVAAQTRFGVLPRALHFYRLHERQVSVLCATAQVRQTARVQSAYQKRFIKKYPQTARLISSPLPKSLKIIWLRNYFKPLVKKRAD